MIEIVACPRRSETTLGWMPACRAFDQDWGGVDDVLCRLCEDSPGHSDRRSVTAKLALVGRAYSAGLERCVTPPKGQQAITPRSPSTARPTRAPSTSH